MTYREASEVIRRILDYGHCGAPGSNKEQALVMAKQALDIFAALESLHLEEPVTIRNRELDWSVTRGYRTHLGGDLTDALGQLCTTLALEQAPSQGWQR